MRLHRIDNKPADRFRRVVVQMRYTIYDVSLPIYLFWCTGLFCRYGSQATPLLITLVNWLFFSRESDTVLPTKRVREREGGREGGGGGGGRGKWVERERERERE